MLSKYSFKSALVVSALSSACGGGEPSTFVAFERDFQGFRRWPGGAFEELPARGQTHCAGDQRYFIRGSARTGSTFPVGTMIVKQARLEARPEGQFFAMVKRGGDYNRQGARGWEWFEPRRAPRRQRRDQVAGRGRAGR